MTPHPLVTTEVPTPEIGSIRVFPWRFTLGSDVYLSTQLHSEPAKVIGGELFLGWPHLHVLDAEGRTWRVPQIHCLSKPISLRA